ncbi:hypothetical protein HanRHA438_Chr03g0122201 [Helianthus annuus]|nr:hypothetical protein HanRHA438_Chr03g0122201 [Helianthus annuus]
MPPPFHRPPPPFHRRHPSSPRPHHHYLPFIFNILLYAITVTDLVRIRIQSRFRSSIPAS